jgi:sugar/nucleoside kinase (ribokinase family)
MAKRIVSVGDLVVDLVLEVQLPVAIDQHQMSRSLQIEPGGATNTIIAARHMGLDVAVLGTVGADFQGQMLKEVLHQERVDTSALVITPDSTTSTVIALTDSQQDGHVFLGHYGEGDLISMTATAQTILFQSDAVFMPGYTLIEERLQPLIEGVLANLATNNILFYFDVGPFLGRLSHERVKDILRITDVLLLTEDEVPFVTQGKTGVDACTNLLGDYPNLLIVLKSGEAGCQIISQQTNIMCHGYKVDVVDTIGAGDSFAGAFMWAHLNGMSLADCGKIANAMGAASVQKTGGGRNTPTCKEVQEVLNTNHVGINLPC